MLRKQNRRLTSPKANTSLWPHALNCSSFAPLTCLALIPCTSIHWNGISVSFSTQSLQLSSQVCCVLHNLQWSGFISLTLSLSPTSPPPLQMTLRSVLSTSMNTLHSACTAMSVVHSLRSTSCCSPSCSVSVYL